MKPLLGYDLNYAINKAGFIWTPRYGQYLKNVDNGAGYLKVSLVLGGGVVNRYVHRYECRLIWKEYMRNYRKEKQVA